MAVVDLEVIKLRTDVPSETTGSRDGFREKLLRRDQRCVYTGIHAELGDGLHLITYKRGSEWFRLIIENRPHEHNDNIRGLVDISDVRNGIFATKSIHTALEGRKLAILKTPNRILDVDDVSPSPDRSLSDEVAYPPNGRYMAQWLTLPSGMSLVQGWLPDNADATLGKHIRTNRPSDLLLHYNYGAAVIENLAERPPDPIRSGKSRALHYRKLAIKKAEAAAKAKKKKTSAGGSKRDTGWDEDDIMLFLGAIQGPQKNATLKSVKQKRRILKSGGKA